MSKIREARELTLLLIAADWIIDCENQTAESGLSYAKNLFKEVEINPLWKDGKHSGDCTRDAHTCLRCTIEGFEAKVNEFLVMFDYVEEEQDNQINTEATNDQDLWWKCYKCNYECAASGEPNTYKKCPKCNIMCHFENRTNAPKKEQESNRITISKPKDADWHPKDADWHLEKDEEKF